MDGVKIGVAALGIAVAVAVGSAKAEELEELGFLLEDPRPEEGAPRQAPAEDYVATDAEPETLPTIPVARSTEEPEPDASPRRRARSALVEEIIVTAQKREESVQDVPISIAAFSGEQMEALGVTNPYDLSNVAPGLQMTESVGFAVTFLRGVGTDAFLMADPSVALYVDDVYLPFSMAANQKFGKLERVEVLKGPQGTLFGRNAVGGAINVVTRKPSLDEFTLSVDLEYGDYNKLAYKVNANLPILDTLAINGTVIGDKRDSYYNGVMNVRVGSPDGVPVPSEDGTGYQLKLLFAPAEWMEIGLNGVWAEEEGVAGLYNPNTMPTGIGRLVGIRPQRGFDDTRTSDPAYLYVDNQIYSGSLKLFFDTFDIKLLGSQQEVAANNKIDFDGSPLPLFAFELENYFADIDTAEFQVLSNDTSWKSENWNWIVGAYYFYSVQGVNPSTATAGSTDLSQNRLLGIEFPPGGIVDSVLSLLGELSPIAGNFIFDGIIGTKSTAAFFQTTYRFTDYVSLTLGGRYQEEIRDLLNSSSYLQTPDGERGVPLFNSNDNERFPDLTSRSFSPKVVFEYRPADQVMTYASWQKAQKSATYNAINLIDFAEPVEPEDIEAYEVGIKSTWFDGLLQANAAAFFYKQKNLQVQFVSVTSGGAIEFENAPRAEVKGADFDVLAELFPETFNGLYLTASGCFLDAVFTEYPEGLGFDPITGLGLGILGVHYDFTGNRIPRSPEFSGRIGLNKIFTLDAGSLEIAADHYYNSGYYVLAENSPKSEQKAYEVTGAHATYVYEPWKLKLTGFVRNIFNEEYYISQLPSDFGATSTLAAPRTIGLQIGWEY